MSSMRDRAYRGRAGRRRAKGLTIVEAMVALVVMSVGMLGIAALYVTGLKSGRSALLRTQAVNLANDAADRIRANRSARASYDFDTYGGAPATHGCINGACNRDELAEDDLARWLADVQAMLPGRPLASADVQFTDVAAPAPDRYTIAVSWHEAGAATPSTYSLVIEQ